jgi:hypothetical protein
MFKNGKTFLELCELVYENLTQESTTKILKALKHDKKLKHDPQSSRLNCGLASGLTTLTTLPGPGFRIRSDL